MKLGKLPIVMFFFTLLVNLILLNLIPTKSFAVTCKRGSCFPIDCWSWASENCNLYCEGIGYSCDLSKLQLLDGQCNNCNCISTFRAYCDNGETFEFSCSEVSYQQCSYMDLSISN